MKLYSYWRSTTSYRVRIALNLKGLSFETVPVDLLAGAQRSEHYKAINPVAGVPSLVLPDGTVLTQSMAILEWLEQAHPEPALLPEHATMAAKVRAAALVMATDVHPVNNLKVVTRLKEMGETEEAIADWMRYWIAQGCLAYAALIRRDTLFSFGDAPSLADICLVAQLYNAHRWQCDLRSFPRLIDIEARCLALPAFDAARPESQPDAA